MVRPYPSKEGIDASGGQTERKDLIV